MSSKQLQSGVYTAMIEASSVAVPSVAEDITYTVAVNVAGGVVRFEGVSPHPSKRWTTYMPLGPNGEVPRLNPFPLGAPVVLHVQVVGQKRIMTIGEGEVPAFGGCP
jgi:hypothetical protein